MQFILNFSLNLECYGAGIYSKRCKLHAPLKKIDRKKVSWTIISIRGFKLSHHKIVKLGLFSLWRGRTFIVFCHQSMPFYSPRVWAPNRKPQHLHSTEGNSKLDITVNLSSINFFLQVLQLTLLPMQTISIIYQFSLAYDSRNNISY